MNYGVPYKGSKSRIAKELIEFFPAAYTFIDLFAGGCAMTHAAMLSGKYKEFIANDIDWMPVQLFMNSIEGKYADRKEWVCRDMFYLLKDSDPYVRYCWSFGNNGENYLYGTDIEPFKKAIHEMIFAETPHKRRLKWKTVYRMIFDVVKNDNSGHGYDLQSLEHLESLKRLERLQSLESLQSLQSLESLERLERLEIYSLDYQDVAIPSDAVIYCDIPYRSTQGYQKGGFDYERFYDWAEKQSNIYISEYWMPEDRFECVWQKEGKSLIAANRPKKIIEKLFIPKR